MKPYVLWRFFCSLFGSEILYQHRSPVSLLLLHLSLNSKISVAGVSVKDVIFLKIEEKGGSAVFKVSVVPLKSQQNYQIYTVEYYSVMRKK